MYHYGPKQGKYYTKADFVTMVSGISAYCGCTKCSSIAPESASSSSAVSSGISSGVCSNMARPSTSRTRFSRLESASSMGPIDCIGQFFAFCRLTSLPDSTNAGAHFTEMPLWAASVVNTWVNPDFASSFPVLPLTITSPIDRQVTPLKSVAATRELPARNSSNVNLISANPSAIISPSSSEVTTLEAVMHSDPMKNLVGELVNMLDIHTSYKKQLKEYHDARAAVEIAQMNARVNSKMEKFKEEIRHSIIEQEKTKARERALIEEESKAFREEAEKQLLSMIDQRIALETAGEAILKGKDFRSKYRQSNVDDIKEALDYLTEELNLIDENFPLNEEQRSYACDLLKDINQEKKEIEETLVNIRYGISHPGKIHGMSYTNTHLELANKLLSELKSCREELVQIICIRGESITDYQEEEQEAETEEEKADFRALEEAINDPSDAIEQVAASQQEMTALLDRLGEDASATRRSLFATEAEEVATRAETLLELLNSKDSANQKLYFDSELSDYGNRSIIDGVLKLQFIRAGVATLEQSIGYFCDKFDICDPYVPAFPVIKKETLKELFNGLLDLLVPGSALFKAALGTAPMPETTEEWADLAFNAGLDLLPLGKALKCFMGPAAKKVIQGKLKKLFVGVVKKRSKKGMR